MKPKTILLKEFTEIINKHDPMNLSSAESDEYESEALSILSRFCEAALQVADDNQEIMKYAFATVNQTFKHWFGKEIVDNAEQMTAELVKAYIESFTR